MIHRDIKPDTLVVTIPGPPVGWRIGQRITRGKGGRGHYVQTYLVVGASRWRDAAVVLIKRAARGTRIDYHVAIDIVAVFPRPGRLSRLRDDPRRLAPDCKLTPDATNVQKLAEDAVVKAGVLVDDSLTNDIHTRRWIAAKGEPPHVVITIRADPALQPLSLFSDDIEE